MFFKVVLIGTVLDSVPDTFVSWGMWLAVIGAMHILCDLGGERFKSIITYSPNSIWTVHFKAISLFLIIMFADLVWFYVCIVEYKVLSIAQKLLLIYECITLFLDSMQGILKYSLYLIDLMKQGWEDRGLYSYYVEFFVQSIKLTASIGYFLTILTLNGIHFGVFELVIVLNLRTIILHLRNKISAYKNYKSLTAEMDTAYPNVSPEELSQIDDNCAICRDPLTSAKKLPCGHLFHTNCLRSWLEYNSSCPSCRFELIRPGSRAPNDREEQAENENPPPQVDRDLHQDQPRPTHTFVQPDSSSVNQNSNNTHARQEPNNHSIWRIDLARWLPSFSVEVVSGSNEVQGPPNEQMRRHLEFIKETFPNFSEEVILRDLMETGDCEQTINNILEGRLRSPDRTSARSDHSSGSSDPIVHRNNDFNTVTTSQNADDANEEILPTFKDSFKSNPEDRQLSFQKRKMMMMESAKKKYLLKSRSPKSGSNDNEDSKP